MGNGLDLFFKGGETGCKGRLPEWIRKSKSKRKEGKGRRPEGRNR
jgi:hypothetical protein